MLRRGRAICSSATAIRSWEGSCLSIPSPPKAVQVRTSIATGTRITIHTGSRIRMGDLVGMIAWEAFVSATRRWVLNARRFVSVGKVVVRKVAEAMQRRITMLREKGQAQGKEGRYQYV